MAWRYFLVDVDDRPSITFPLTPEAEVSCPYFVKFLLFLMHFGVLESC